jgi:integrase
MDSLRYTYNHLRDEMLRRIDTGTGPSASSKANLLSALHRFLDERGFRYDDVIASDLRASYQRNVNAHVAGLKALGHSSSYISNRKALLSQWRRCLLDADRASAAREGRQSPLQSALADLVKKAASVRGTARRAGVPLATLKRWLKGAVPNAASARHLPRLERYFALPAGALSDLVAPGAHASARQPQSTVRDAYRERQRTNSRSPYAIKNPLPRLRNEWLQLLQFKTSTSLSHASAASESEENGRFSWRPGRRRSGLAKRRGAVWTGTTLPVVSNPDHAWYATVGERYSATAAVAWTLVSQFLGWLRLPAENGGGGLSPDNAQTLANLTRDDYIERYIDWRVRRAGGVVHHGVRTFLTFVRSLCNPQFGFLTQSFPLFAGLANAQDETQWREYCRECYEFAKDAAEEASQHLQRSRDPFRAIGPALDMLNPLDAVADAVARLDADRPSTGGLKEAVWARDCLLLKLMASNPLRDKNLRLLTYRADNTGHLRKVAGEWRIVIPRHEFKNFRGAARHRDYNMLVRPEVSSDIERYLRDYRPMLADPDNPYVFVSSARPKEPMHNLRRRFALLTRAYLAGCPGVGPHAMRHIVATSILKARPNDWAAAAWALHDTEETVRKHYVHLRCDDAQRWMKDVMDGPFARM